MPVDREDWSRRIKAVERQYNAVRFSTERLRTQLHADPTIANRFPDAANIAEASKDLEITYFIRMFAVFESGLRSYWRSQKPGRKPKTEDLINGVASRCKIPNELLVGSGDSRLQE